MRFSEDIGIDLGTATFLIYSKSRGLVLQEPSVIAMTRDSKQVKAVGEEAYRMIGRTPGGIIAVRPIKDGVIADELLTERMITMFLQKVQGGAGRLFGLKPQLMVGIPSNVSDVERRAVLRAALNANARRAFLIEEPLAAAIGAGIKIAEPVGSMIVDIGGGSSDIAVISLGGIVVSESLRVAGDEFDESIIRYVRRKHNVLVGERTAEEIKVKVGAATLLDESENLTAEVRGRDLVNGLPKTITLDTREVVEALAEPVSQIVEGVKRVLEITPPELVSDILDHGIVMTGGGSLLRNFDQLIQQATNIPVRVADNAVEAVAVGTGMALEMIPVLGDSLVSSDHYLRR
ncbi:rod shape-determining protein [Deinococcus aetherius]|uniref:Cell shape-determining protein MreB n=1 Tax=Deinococcus aetherius TaxID=200252 RepID=A0ABM8ACW7_9DEIO|nr:rod shape-determining protein [Deinococcus aetherius]BDP41459.1 rod shape-determining protein [Deinococcus aetherius]